MCGDGRGFGHLEANARELCSTRSARKAARCGCKPVSAEQMELARLRAELVRVKMERDILKKRQRILRGNQLEVRLD